MKLIDRLREIRGTSPIDLRNININFRDLLQNQKNILNAKNPTYSSGVVSGINCFRQGKFITIQGNISFTEDLTGDRVILNLQPIFSPINTVNIILYTSTKKMVIGTVSPNGEVYISLGEDILPTNEFLIINNVFIGA